MAKLWKTGGPYSDFFFSFEKEEKQAILYIRNIDRKQFIRTQPELFSFDCFSLKNINETKCDENRLWFNPNLKKGNAGVLILVTSNTRKELIDIPERFFHSKNAQVSKRVYLQEEDLFDYSSREVQGVVSQINNTLSVEKKGNPYFQALSALQWSNWNIKYCRATKEMVKKLEKSLYQYPNHDIYSLLLETFTSNELPGNMSEIKKIASDIIVPGYMTKNFQKACYILNEFDRKHPFFLERWPFENYLSASNTIRNRLGKCDCITHVFIALCRAMGIPAIKILGQLHPEGWHAWASIYLHPFGWIDVDPTNSSRFEKFNHRSHLYHILGPQFKGEVDFLPLDEPITDEMIHSCKKFYEQSSVNPSLYSLLSSIEK